MFFGRKRIILPWFNYSIGHFCGIFPTLSSSGFSAKLQNLRTMTSSFQVQQIYIYHVDRGPSMRVAHSLLVWAAAVGLVGHALAIGTSRPHHAKNPQQRGHARRGAVTPGATRSGPARPAALVEGSDETIEPYSKNQPG